MATGNGGWLIGIGGAIAGTAIGSLVLRGFGLGLLDQRLKAIEASLNDLRDRVARIEKPLIDKAISE